MLNYDSFYRFSCSRNAQLSLLCGDILFTLDQTRLLRVPLWIGHCRLCTEGYLKLRLHSSFNLTFYDTIVHDLYNSLFFYVRFCNEIFKLHLNDYRLTRSVEVQGLKVYRKDINSFTDKWLCSWQFLHTL